MLVKKNKQTTRESEFRQFLARRILRSRLRMSSEKAFQTMEFIGLQGGFSIMPLARYRELMSCLSGYDVIGRSGADDDDSWFQQDRLLVKMHSIEEVLFQNSVNLLLNRKSGSLVIDDELVASRANDVEAKMLTNRKKGKEGSVSDCIACSLTNVFYGMRLRTKGVTQFDNVRYLLDRMGDFGGTGGSVAEVACDRGYGKMTFVEEVCQRQLGIKTVANTVGSRHPYILNDEVQKKVSEWRRKGVSSADIERRIDLVSEWIVDSDEMLGAGIRIAKRNVGGYELHAVAVRDIFDRNKEGLDLRFFSTQKSTYTWVAIPKPWLAEKTCLFTKTRLSDKRREIEAEILRTCNALTLSQRCADWFLLKQLVSGTMASKIVGRANDDGSPPSDDLLCQLLDQCLKSWYGRYTGTEAMRIGSENEEATVTKLSKESCIDCVFEVGLLCQKYSPEIGVSPDGIAIVIMPSGEKVFASVEVKTRVAESTIETATEALNDHGRIVFCDYNSDVFRDCVPAYNRSQVLHQAYVIDLKCVVFVTAKVEDAEGSIVQVVVITFSADDLRNHRQKIELITKPLL